MHALELKVPPVVVVLITTSVMVVLAQAAPSLGFEMPARNGVALGLVLMGAAVAIAGVVAFRRAHTTVNPMQPQTSAALVQSGPYRFTRNPMYLGMLLGLGGLGVWLSNVLALLLLPAFVLYMNRFQIEPEERTLAAIFGGRFVTYQAAVRRWL